MKCYLCGFKNDNAAEVKKHYLDFHKVDPNNQFFKKLFNDSQNKVSRTGQCVRCKEFLPTNSFRKRHNFLNHYDAGRSTAAAIAEEKPISISNIGTIKVYKIRFENHSSDYDFLEPEQLVNEFLSKSFNDFVLFHIRDTILKRVIITGLTGSSWRFR